MTSKEKYIALCDRRDNYVPLFMQPWWMDTVCHGKQWDVLLTMDGDTIVAAMPFVHGRKFGLEYVLQPQLTPWTGPWLHPALGDAARRDALVRMAADLHRWHPALCKLCLMPGFDDCEPFGSHGFEVVPRRTYRFPSIADTEALYRAASRVRRRYDKSVAAQCEVDTSLSIDEFVPFHVNYYRRRGQRDLIAEPLLRKVVGTACGRGQGMLWGLRNRADHRLQAAWFVAFDEQCAWSLLLAIGADAPHGSMSYLMWQMLHELSAHTRSFDFEGGMDPDLAFFYSSFGTVETPYHCIYRSLIPFGKKILHL